MRSRVVAMLSVALGIWMTGCEVDIELQKDGRLGYALNSIISEDTTIIAYVSNYYSVGEVIDERKNKEDLFDFISSGKVTVGNIPNEYEYKGHVDDAKVTCYVNGDYKGVMVYVDGDNAYISDYKPKAGDEITIKAENQEDESIKVSASTRLLAQSDFDIESIEKIYMAKEGYYGEKSLSDTVLKIVVRLHDPAGEKNFYRLKVRSKIADMLDPHVNDVFWSEDPLFYDKDLWMKIGNWRVGTTPFFDDSSFDGKDREFTIYHRPEKKTRAYQLGRYECFVDVQSITEDVYLHQKSLLNYMQSGESTYGEPVYIHSNTSTGFGVVGGITSNRHHIEDFINVEAPSTQ